MLDLDVISTRARLYADSVYNSTSEQNARGCWSRLRDEEFARLVVAASEVERITPDARERISYLERLNSELTSAHNRGVIREARADERIAALEADTAALVEALGFYELQTRLCRLIHSEGDAGRNALAKDGGEIARAAVSSALREKVL